MVDHAANMGVALRYTLLFTVMLAAVQFADEMIGRHVALLRVPLFDIIDAVLAFLLTCLVFARRHGRPLYGREAWILSIACGVISVIPAVLRWSLMMSAASTGASGTEAEAAAAEQTGTLMVAVMYQLLIFAPVTVLLLRWLSNPFTGLLVRK